MLNASLLHIYLRLREENAYFFDKRTFGPHQQQQLYQQQQQQQQ